MLPFVIGAKRAVKKTARKAALGAVAGVTGLVALGFFTGAAYLWLKQEWSAIAAAATIGGLYLLVAVIAAAMAGSGSKPEPEPLPSAALWTAVAEAFLIGLSATRKKR